MSANNPHFQHVGRAAYELPYLMKSLGEVDGAAALTSDQAHKVDAISSHAYNAAEVVISGLESIGQLMSMVGNGGDELGGRQMASLGDLIKHLAVEIEYLHEVEGEMCALKRRSITIQQEPASAPRQRAAART